MVNINIQHMPGEGKVAVVTETGQEDDAVFFDEFIISDGVIIFKKSGADVLIVPLINLRSIILTP
ncbi:MAG TPA: hypothetical protein PKE63_02860 [Lacibacter sp.]|nr:hypothetical protein [Lacibacter sp.]HMO89551.1 hypothetical protein [Lacibacter sp.]HMP86186.1 hypothetical protein [Lacibacter sp.]